MFPTGKTKTFTNICNFPERKTLTSKSNKTIKTRKLEVLILTESIFGTACTLLIIRNSSEKENVCMTQPTIAIECEKIDIFRESVKMLISFILNIKRKLVRELPTIRNYIHKQCNMVVVFCCNRELLVNFKKVISFRFHLRDNLVYKCSQESLSVWLF